MRAWRWLKALSWLEKGQLLGLVFLVYVVVGWPLMGVWGWGSSISVLVGLAILTALAVPELFTGAEIFVGVMAMALSGAALHASQIEVELAFFNATAQVIPVVFLALSAAQLLAVRGRHEVERRTGVLLAAGLIWAEYRTLYVLGSGVSTNSDLIGVGGPLIGAAVALLLLALLGFTPSASSANETK